MRSIDGLEKKKKDKKNEGKVCTYICFWGKNHIHIYVQETRDKVTPQCRPILYTKYILHASKRLKVFLILVFFFFFFGSLYFFSNFLSFSLYNINKYRDTVRMKIILYTLVSRSMSRVLYFSTPPLPRPPNSSFSIVCLNVRGEQLVASVIMAYCRH